MKVSHNLRVLHRIRWQDTRSLLMRDRAWMAEISYAFNRRLPNWRCVLLFTPLRLSERPSLMEISRHAEKFRKDRSPGDS
jgi:hypothetical protein